MDQSLEWGDGALRVRIAWSDSEPARLAEVTTRTASLELGAGIPLVEVMTASEGHSPSSDRLIHTEMGRRLRLTSHRVLAIRGGETLELDVDDAASDLGVTVILERRHGIAALRSRMIVRNGGPRRVVLRSIASFSAALAGDPRDWTIHHADSDWLAENRWTTTPLAGPTFPDLAETFTSHDPRGEFSVVSSGTWSTGKHLPVGAAVSSAGACVWEIEHNGPWRWDVGIDTATAWFSASGPTHPDHAWLAVLDPGGSFESVPVSVAYGDDLTGAIGELTEHRRAARRPHPDNERMPVIFNDYMNTLSGDPTTEKLLPLIDAAAAAGAEVFCIDAGWYDDGGDWWDSVGDWRPSTTRFPGGIDEVISRIRAHGMIAGLWLEPEVVGIKSPAAEQLPDDAFLSLAGLRIVEHERFHLDLRSPAARQHLDDVVDRLVHEHGVGYFKLDYNIDPHTGSDRDAVTTGAALLEHNRAHLDWIDGVLDRHPELILENCGSGGMRSDAALLSRFQLQSTSDQQDFLKYPPIAASAPMAMLPEQAASWAYPQSGMDAEQFAFCLVTGLVGRFFLSGHLNNVDPEQLTAVTDAVAAAKELHPRIRRATPFWPLGLPGWDDAWIALGLDCGDERILALWCRDADAGRTAISIPDLAHQDLEITTIFPRRLDDWHVDADGESGTLRIVNPTGSIGARLFRLAPVGAPSTTAPSAHSASGSRR